ncbi:hypothetical protein [Stackebrandtia soli]|uniref:hypothetical protein n=1 Tax=Stackebrandtia soli TaxID=1892856 RepID=UPI0039E98B00
MGTGLGFDICELLEHDCAETPEPHTAEWDASIEIPAHVHLLDRWWRDDSPKPTIRILADLRDGPDSTSRLETAGLFPELDPSGHPRRRAVDGRKESPERAAEIVTRTLRANGIPSRRTELLMASLASAIVDWADDATLVRVVDPESGTIVEQETHVVLGFGRDLIRMSVLGAHHVADDDGRDPACSFAGHWCRPPHRSDPVDLAGAEVRLRALCAGTVLKGPLDLDGPAAFKVGWSRHGMPSGADITKLRRWWNGTAWMQNHPRDYLDEELAILDDPQAVDLDEWDSFDELQERLELGDPDDDSVVHADGLRPMDSAAFTREIRAFGAACVERAPDDQRELTGFLLDELLHRPLERVGGADGRLSAWADHDGDARFWRDGDGDVNCHDDARRVLVVGPDEAVYFVFKSEMGS